MQTQFTNGWPQERDNPDWRHGDIKEVAYTFVFRAFDAITQLGDLK